MNNTLFTILSWIFGIVVVAIGIVNTFWGNDTGFGIFILLLSLTYFLPLHSILKGKVKPGIVTAGKFILGALILWMALGVGELFDKIDLMTAGL